MPQGIDVEDLKSKFLNEDFDTKEFIVRAENIDTVARVSGEQRPEYTDPQHPDFQVPPALLCSLASGRHLPIDFPSIGGIPMDGGKAVMRHAPVRADETLIGKTHLHDIYDKTGRSGQMVFIVARSELYDEDGEHYATLDARQVIREMPDQ